MILTVSNEKKHTVVQKKRKRNIAENEEVIIWNDETGLNGLYWNPPTTNKRRRF